MKPVPISQYLDHIGRAAQADPQSPRRETSPFKPRAVRMVQDPEPRVPLAFSRALREAATAARERALEDGQERDASDGDRRAARPRRRRRAKRRAIPTSRRGSPKPMIAACARARPPRAPRTPKRWRKNGPASKNGR